MRDRPVLLKLPPSKLKSLDELLTPEQEAELRADLTKIANTVRPCWRREG